MRKPCEGSRAVIWRKKERERVRLRTLATTSRKRRSQRRELRLFRLVNITVLFVCRGYAILQGRCQVSQSSAINVLRLELLSALYQLSTPGTWLLIVTFRSRVARSPVNSLLMFCLLSSIGSWARVQSSVYGRYKVNVDRGRGRAQHADVKKANSHPRPLNCKELFCKILVVPVLLKIRNHNICI